ERPSTSSRLPTMLPVMDAFTSATCPFLSATTAMMSSAALPNVALRNPPSAGPDRSASCSVPSPISPARGISETAAVMNSHGDSPAFAARNHDAGAATSSRLIGDETIARSISSVAELFQVFLVCAGEKIEECVEAAIERAAQLRDRAVEGMKREARRGTVGELQRPFFNALESAFRDQANAVDERIAGHPRIIQAGRTGPVGRLAPRGVRFQPDLSDAEPRCR